MNRYAAQNTFSEVTFPVCMTSVGLVGRLGMPFSSYLFMLIFETIHDHLSAILYPLVPNVNSRAAIGALREPTFPLSMTFVGTMGILDIPLASPVFS